MASRKGRKGFSLQQVLDVALRREERAQMEHNTAAAEERQLREQIARMRDQEQAQLRTLSEGARAGVIPPRQQAQAGARCMKSRAMSSRTLSTLKPRVCAILAHASALSGRGLPCLRQAALMAFMRSRPPVRLSSLA